MFVGEKFHDALRDPRPDFVDFFKFLRAGFHDRVQRAEMLRQKLCGALANKPCPQTVNDALKRKPLGGFDLRQHVFRRLLAHALELQQVVFCQLVEIGDILDQASFGKLIYQGIAEAVDIHDVTRGKMQNRALQLRWTIRIHATMVRLARRSHHVAAAHRAVLGHCEIPAAARMLFIFDDLHHLRNHISAALHFDPVADLHSETIDLIHVVQRGARNRRAANRNRLQPRHGRQLAGAPDLWDDVLDLRHAPARGVLIGNRPPRSLAGEAQFPLPRGAVHFDNDPVNLVRERFAFLLPALDKFPGFFQIFGQPAIRIDFESRHFQRIHRF